MKVTWICVLALVSMPLAAAEPTASTSGPDVQSPAESAAPGEPQRTSAPQAAEGPSPGATEPHGPAAAPQAAEAPEPAAPAVPGYVSRDAVTTGVVEREPVNDLQRVETDLDRIVYFSELRDMEGQTAIHRWEHEGEILAEIPFKIGGPRWRVWSSKNLRPEWQGEWTVTVLNDSGEVIEERAFVYRPAAMQEDLPMAPDAELAAPPADEPAASPSEEPAASAPSGTQ